MSITIRKTPCPPAVTRSTATLMKTGQTTSYRTGDDGDIEAGRDTDFLTLDSAPVHNDGSATINLTTNRFTDTLGGSTYANDWVLDWSTWNGSTLLGYYRVENGVNINWNDSIDAAITGTFGGYSGCRLPNCKEMINAFNYEGTALNYSPFNISTGFLFWTSTTNTSSAASAYVGNNSTKNIIQTTKTTSSNCRYLPVRIFSLSTSNILS